MQFFGQELAAPGAGGNFFVIFALFFATNIAALVVVVFGYQETLVVAPGAQPSTLRGVWLEQSAWRLWARPAVQAWRSRPLRQLSASYALYYAALMSFRTIATFFAKKAPYDYGPEAIGWLVALQGIVRALAILALLPLWLHMRSSANLTRHATPGGGNAMLLQAMRFGLVWGVLTILALAASVRTGGGAVLFTLTAAAPHRAPALLCPCASRPFCWGFPGQRVWACRMVATCNSRPGTSHIQQHLLCNCRFFVPDMHVLRPCHCGSVLSGAHVAA